MIELLDGHFIAQGAYCSCYEHPKDSNKCIKIPTKNAKANKHLKADLRYYRHLRKKRTDLSYIANYLGSTETNRGQGFVYECVRDDDGQISITLENYLSSTDVDRERVLKPLKMLANYLVDNQILISDLHARNILVKKGRDGSIKPMIVDGIGDRVAITLLNILPAVTKAKIVRRWNRFSEKTLGSNHTLAR